MKTIKLGEIAEIIGGQIMTRVKADKPTDSPIGEVKVIVPKAIEETGMINVESLAKESIKTDVDLKKTAHEGDIIIKLNSPYDSGQVTKDLEGAVIPSFCARISIKKSVGIDCLIPDYLLAFLNSKRCKKQIELMVQGSVMGIVSVGRLKDIEVPLPEVSGQFSIANNYLNTQNRLMLLAKIIKLEQLSNDACFNELEKYYGA